MKTRHQGRARPWLRSGAIALGMSLVLASCYSRGALDQKAASPDTRPYYCDAVGDGTPPSGHGNGAHVSPIYEGMEKGELSWDDCIELSAQIDLALNSVKDVMTRGEAEADGWREVAQYIPGLGTHHAKSLFGRGPGLPPGFELPPGCDPREPDFDPTGCELPFDPTDPDFELPPGFELPPLELPPWNPAEPTFLIYGGEDEDAPLAGVAYAAFGVDEPPEAFAGDNDWWHLHEKLCIGQGLRILAGAEEIPDEECDALGGTQISLGSGLWLLHLWMVPDYALKYDIFTSGHPCLGESGPLPGDDPCWDLANHEPADGPPPWMSEHDDGHGGHDEHGTGEHDDDLGWSELSNGHQHEQGVEPLTNEEQAELAKQLAPTEDLMEDYPTLADAEAAGYRRAGPFAPGAGVHYAPPLDQPIGGADDGASGVGGIPLLIYDGLEPDSKLAGFMYMTMGGEEPEGFAGPNDHWHYHENLCVKFGDDGIELPLGVDREDVTEEMCDQMEGRFLAITGYMLHVWNVPGYESPDGLFSGLNSEITCPDGTYYIIPVEEWGEVDSICQDP